MEEEDKGKLRALDKISEIRGREMRCRDYHRTSPRERLVFLWFWYCFLANGFNQNV